MSAPAIDEFRALLALFCRSDLRDLWVSAEDWSVFLAKPGGSVHPQAPTTASQATTSAAPNEVVTAPHLGIVTELLPPATRIDTGDQIAVIDVLDEHRMVLAERPGTVGTHLTAAGELVEYGQALLEIV